MLDIYTYELVRNIWRILSVGKQAFGQFYILKWMRRSEILMLSPMVYLYFMYIPGSRKSCTYLLGKIERALASSLKEDANLKA